MFRDEPAFKIRDGCGRGAFDMIAANGKFGHAYDSVPRRASTTPSLARCC
jgi:hypothetical protein